VAEDQKVDFIRGEFRFRIGKDHGAGKKGNTGVGGPDPINRSYRTKKQAFSRDPRKGVPHGVAGGEGTNSCGKVTRGEVSKTIVRQQ